MLRMPAATKKGGTAVGGPDVCKTPPAPPVPVPYPNLGEVASSDNTVSKVLIENKETVVENSKIPSSKGDEPGTLKGMISQTQGSSIQFKQSSSKVYAQGKKIVFHTAATSHNGSNANAPIGVHASPSQTTVFVAT